MLIPILILVKAAVLTLIVQVGPTPVQPWDPDVPTCDVQGDYASCDDLVDWATFNCDEDVTCSDDDLPKPPPPPASPKPDPSSLANTADAGEPSEDGGREDEDSRQRDAEDREQEDAEDREPKGDDEAERPRDETDDAQLRIADRQQDDADDGRR